MTLLQKINFYLWLKVLTKSYLSYMWQFKSFGYHCICLCAQSCPILCNPRHCSPLGSFVHGIFQARILEWVAISSSRESSRPRDRTHVSYVSGIGRWLLYHWATPLYLFKNRTWYSNTKTLLLHFLVFPYIGSHYILLV